MKLFEMLMGKITQKVHANYRDELIKALVACLATDSLCFSVWRSLHVKNLYQSHLLLTYIGNIYQSFIELINESTILRSFHFFRS